MYSHKRIENFIDKVNKEAELAAQQIFDKYKTQLIEMIQSQLKDNDCLFVGMGTASIEPETYKAQEFERLISGIQYYNLSASFYLTL